jgi:YtcA family
MRVDRASRLRHGRPSAAGNSRLVRRGKPYWTTRNLWQVAITLVVSGCSHSPTMDLLGSYFPAWMLCVGIGILAAVIIRQILALAGIHEYVVAPLLTYAAFAVSATLLAWLLWFGH